MKRARRKIAPLLARAKSVISSKRFWKYTGVIVGAIILLQLIFPYDRAFFLSQVDGQPVGLKTKAEIEQLVKDRYKDGVVATTQPTSRTSFAETGVQIDATSTAERATDYPVWQRLIPLSSVARLFTSRQASEVNYLKLSNEQWASDIEAQCAVVAKDAGVEIRDGRLAVTPSVEGAKCSKDNVIAALKSTKPAPEMKVNTARQVVAPKRSDAAVAAQVKKIEAVIAKGVSVDVMGAKVTAEPSEIVGWLVFADGENNQLKLDVDPAKLQDFIARVQRPIYVAPGTSVVAMRDGVETGRTTGANGRGVDSNDLITQLRQELNQQDAITLTAKVTDLPPKVVYSRSYTNSTAGLQALITDIAAEKGNMAIAITEIDGQRRNVSANGDKQYHPASTYKLFVAYGVIKRIEANQWKWNDQVGGTTVDECLTRMIVNSDNACAEAFAEKIGGWGAVQTDVKATGATGTNLNLGEPVGTVKDQVLFLTKLQNNQLMKQENRDKLLALMKRQQYRAGIPSGVKFDVADKVGFLGANLHDSGLIYTPHGVYALSIYSTGGSWGNIADAARRIEALLLS